MSLKDKVALITGAGSGIGRATAKIFAMEGARVVVADIDPEKGEETAKIIRNEGGQGVFIKVDVTKWSDCERMVATATETYGKLDILFNNAGINPLGTVVDTSEELWDKIIDINLKGVFLSSKYAIPVLAKQGGVIINNASVNGLVALPDEAAYDASKGGVIMLTKAMAIDHGHQNIRVNCVCPGVTDTPLIRRYIDESNNPEEQLKVFVKYNAVLHRLIKPEEVAYVVLFLASDEASAVTGAVYPVDGGYTTV
jgi:NAD(P)-dependent dehydrogenase (short-subunit alcohol dehydrogenase family)